MRPAGDLGKTVLRDVSRSFYLSLRLLPSGFRGPASVGYLLARLSDSLADAGAVSQRERVSLLEQLGDLVQGEAGDTGEMATGFFGELERLADSGGWTPGEAVLLRRARDVLQWLGHLPGDRQALVRDVIETIIGGQKWDLTRFEGDGLVRLDRDEELIDYTYRVAGCVGEFWTRLGFACHASFATEPPAVMEKLGRSYGQGLQLVNVLRDVAEDWERGRCYLPGPDAGAAPDELLTDCGRWRTTAAGHLRDGLRYCEQVRGRRLGFASGLPALLGLLTLRKLEGATWPDLQGKVKVTRAEVRRAARCALGASLSRRPGRWERAWRRLSEVAEAG